MRTAAELELDLDVFAGPFDLLLTLVLREEVDLLEVDLADVVLAYLDHLEARGELDLEVATEFLVLIAALLELKSRLMLPREEEEELASSRRARRPRSCSRACSSTTATAAPPRYLHERLAAEAGPPLPLGAAAARAAARLARPRADGVYDPTRSAPRSARCCASRRRSTPRHLAAPRVRSPSGSSTCATCCAAGRFTFDEAVADADRITVAVTLFALLELYKQGEATWEQPEPFGEITIEGRSSRPRERVA